MAEYTVTVEDYETGLTASALRSQIKESFPQQDVTVSVDEQ